MDNKIDYRYLIDDAKINLSLKLKNKINQYKQHPTKELKIDILQLIQDRQNLFLFNINTIQKYLK